MGRNSVERFAVQLGVWIDRIIQRFAFLQRRQSNVAPRCKLHAIRVMGAEVIIMQIRMLPGFGRVDGNPAEIVAIAAAGAPRAKTALRRPLQRLGNAFGNGVRMVRAWVLGARRFVRGAAVSAEL